MNFHRAPNSVYKIVRDAIMRIFESRSLGDVPRFRVYGHVCAYKMGKFPHKTLQEFKRIQLVSWVSSTSKIDVIDITTIADIQWRTQQNDKIYRFLKRCQHSKVLDVARETATESETPVDVGTVTTPVPSATLDVQLKLARLKMNV